MSKAEKAMLLGFIMSSIALFSTEVTGLKALILAVILIACGSIFILLDNDQT